MTHLLIAPQYSNYNREGIYMLHADSSANMTFNKLREMLRLDPKLTVDVLVPERDQTLVQPEELTKDIKGIERVTFLRQRLANNALKTRFDFKYDEVLAMLQSRPKYTHVYLMDPMLVRNFKAMFHISLKYRPFIICNSHFIDDPRNPVVPAEVQYWYGQVEGHIKADLNVWQCSSALETFCAAANEDFKTDLVQKIVDKSYSWDAGYSAKEMSTPVDEAAATKRFLHQIPKDKIIVFVPNRMGGTINGVQRSFDYTNAGKFVLEVVNEVWKKRQDFVVIAGNPNQKITNAEIEERVPAYLRLLEDGTFERHEYMYVARNSDIVVGLFNVDSYGGTAWRECVDQGCTPLLADCYEQHTLLEKAHIPDHLRVKADISNAADAFDSLLNYVKAHGKDNDVQVLMSDLVKKECSFERTTKKAMKAMGML